MPPLHELFVSSVCNVLVAEQTWTNQNLKFVLFHVLLLAYEQAVISSAQFFYVLPNDLLLTFVQSRDSSSINEKSEKGKQCFFGTCSSLPSLGAALKIKTEIMHVFIALLWQ